MRAAMAELKVMLFLKFHEKVIKVIGASTTELLNRESSNRVTKNQL